MSNFLENLPSASGVSPTDILLINQGAVSKKITAAGLLPIGFAYNYQTGVAYTAVLSDFVNTIIRMSNASTNLVTIPKNSASLIIPIGFCLIIQQYNTGQTGFTGASGVTLLNPSSNNCRVRYSTIAAIQDATDEWIICGDVA